MLLFSGGIDSTVLASWLRPERLFFVDYGQVSAPGEERAVVSIARDLGLPLDVRRVDLRVFGHGTMTGGAALNPDAPEFWPYRNQMLITMAAMAYADRAPLSIVIGTVLGDDVHPDGSAAFREAMAVVLATQGNTTLEAPGAAATTEQTDRYFGITPVVAGLDVFLSHGRMGVWPMPGLHQARASHGVGCDAGKPGHWMNKRGLL